jgi:pyruvate ferredoxin oxidoreductase alpha subunit
MKNELLSCLEGAAYAAKLAHVDYVPNFPVPFSHEIAEKLGKIHDCKISEMQTQSAAISSAMTATLIEKRVLLPLSSLDYIDDFYVASYIRLPLVGVNVSRLIDEYAVRHGHQDVMALLNAGWLIFMPESVQEVVDSIIHAYRICEDSKVMLPALINVDMVIRETVQLPSDQFVGKFLPKLKMPFKLDIKNPEIIGFPSEDYDEMKIQQQLAMKNALALMPKVYEKWYFTKRRYDVVEKYMLDDAEYALVVSGFNSTTAKAAVNKLREQGKKVGLLRLRVIRPWPREEIMKAIGSVKKVAVLDQDISVGSTGVLYPEVKAWHNGFISNYISLGKHLSEKNFFEMFERLEKSEKEEVAWV